MKSVLKKALLCTSVLALSSSASAYEFVINDIAAKPGTTIEVDVWLNVDALIKDIATAIDIYAPEGYEFATEIDEWDDVQPAVTMHGTYALTKPAINGNCLSLSTISSRIKESSELVKYATFKLNVTNSATNGSFKMTTMSVGYNYLEDKSFVANVLNDITINANGYASYSVCAPVEVTGATVMGATLNGNSLTLTGDGNAVPAKTGVILKGAPGATVSFTPAEAADEIDSDLSPAVLPTTVAAESVLTLSKSEAAFYTFTGTEIPAQKAYLNKSAMSGRVRIVESANGIDTIKGEMQPSNTYNLMGQQTDSQKGFVIENGQKVVKF